MLKRFNSIFFAGLTMLVTSMLLVTYSIVRASKLSLTHDEADSFLAWYPYNILQCHSDPHCWESANLHWLYVLMMKFFVQLMGNTELAIRLPSVCAHVIYLIASLFLIKKIIEKYSIQRPWIALLGFTVLNFNPYLLEFFALARGYALSIAFMFCSVYFLYCWMENKKTVYLLGIHTSVILAILSNFILINFYICVNLILILGALFMIWKEKRSASRELIKVLSTFLLFSCILTLMIYYPIQRLRAIGEFEWGADSFMDTLFSLAFMFTYKIPGIEITSMKIILSLTLLFVIAGGFKSMLSLMSNPDNSLHRFNTSIVLLIVLISLASISQNILFDSKYLTGRKALFYIPLINLAAFNLLLMVIHRNINWPKIAIASSWGFYCLIQLISSIQWKSCYEWSYDSQNKKMLTYLDQLNTTGKNINVGVQWLFEPSCSYYTKTRNFTSLHCSSVDPSTLGEDDTYDFYYIQREDVKEIPHGYILEKNFGDIGYLLKNTKSPH